jgi:hypothetical protein
MMPTIRVDDEVFAWLQSKARPFEDTPNSVLRREAGLDGDGTSGAAGSRTSPPGPQRVYAREGGAKTPQGEFRAPILKILKARGGRADRSFVLRELERVLAGKLTAFDKQDIKSGTIRWQKSAEWEVSTMRQEGLLLPRSDSPHGVWCLSATGERAAKNL